MAPTPLGRSRALALVLTWWAVATTAWRAAHVPRHVAFGPRRFRPPTTTIPSVVLHSTVPGASPSAAAAAAPAGTTGSVSSPSSSSQNPLVSSRTQKKRGSLLTRAMTAIPYAGGAPSGGVLLALTICLEVLGTTCMKLTATSNLYYIGVALGYGLCFSVFPMVLRQMPLGVAYAIWSGAGTVATAAVSATFFGESMTLPKILSIGCIVVGVVGLNYLGGGGAH